LSVYKIIRRQIGVLNLRQINSTVSHGPTPLQPPLAQDWPGHYWGRSFWGPACELFLSLNSRPWPAGSSWRAFLRSPDGRRESVLPGEMSLSGPPVPTCAKSKLKWRNPGQLFEELSSRFLESFNHAFTTAGRLASRIFLVKWRMHPPRRHPPDECLS